MKKIIFGIVALFFISCNEKPEAKFSLTGTTNGVKNGTTLYLDNPLEKKLIDSAKVENNSFYFQSKLSKTPLQVILRTKNYSHYRFLWLEDNPMTFHGAKTDFRHSNVTGSDSEKLSQDLRNKIAPLSRHEKLKCEMEFVNNNPNSIVSASILSVYSTTFGKEKTTELFEKFSTKNRNSEYGKSISKFLGLNRNPKVGEKYVDFKMEDINGEIRKLSDFKGKTVLLEFWSSNCGACRAENPNLIKLYQKYNSQGFEIFAVSHDVNKSSWLKAIETDKLPWMQVCDLKGRDNSAFLIYGIQGIPDNFLIDRNGVIIGRNLRVEKLKEKLAKIMTVNNSEHFEECKH